MKTIRFTQATGGQGTTTLAVTLASRLAAQGRRTLLIGHDPDPLAAVLGLPQVRDDQAGSILHVGDFASDRTPLALAVLDTCEPGWSIRAFAEQYQADVCVLDGTDYLADRTYLVVRGPDYLGMRAALRQDMRADGIVLVQETGRAMCDRDVTELLGGVPVVVTIPVCPSIARAVDAGLLIRHATASRKMDELDNIEPGVDHMGETL